MSNALYRLSTREVLKISVTAPPQTFSDADPAFFGVLIGPTTPDGTNVRDVFGVTPGPLRVLGFAKIAEPGGNNARNAIQAEIDTFAAGETDDDNQQDANRAKDLLDVHPQFRKLMIAFSDIIKDEINILRRRNEGFKDDVAAANSLGDLKSAVAGYAAQPARTLTQLKNQLNTRINKND